MKLENWMCTLLNYLVWQHEKKNDRAKGLKMVLGDDFIDCFFFTPICLGKMVDELPETNMFQLNIDVFEDFFFGKA